MSRFKTAALFLIVSALFLLANRAAYRGYFHDDDLNNLSWTRYGSAADYLERLFNPGVERSNFRPPGHFFYHVMANYFDLDFPKYVAVIHAVHFVNVYLVWLLARSIGIPWQAAWAGALFFGFHMAVFDAYWYPQDIFDLLCGTFSLLSLLLYARRRWVLSFLAFWLAYKSKEIAVMLPAVLLLYEFCLGKRRWKVLVPFLVVSLSFGLQALLLNREATGEYGLRFTPASAWSGIRFYASRIFLIPYGGFLLAVLPFLARDRRVCFGLGASLLLLLPLLALPGRLHSDYWYVPLFGVALALAGAVARHSMTWAVLFFVLWIPWNIHHLRLNRRKALAIADENRAYVSALADFARSSPVPRFFVLDGAPGEFRRWGIEGALDYFYRDARVPRYSVDEPGARTALESGSVAVLSWDQADRRLSILVPAAETQMASYIEMNRTPVWQLKQGWYPVERRMRWMEPYASASLLRPEDAGEFELILEAPAELFRERGYVDIRVSLEQHMLGSQRIFRYGRHNLRWILARAPGGPTTLEFRVQPAYVTWDERRLGVAVIAFGFLPRE